MTSRLTPFRAGWIVLATGVTIHLPTLAQPLVEHHSFRQTTTAFPALIFAEQGIDLLHPQLPVFGPPFVFPLEFPLVQALIAFGIDLSLSADVAARAVGLASFAITAGLLWLLVRKLGGEAAGLAALAVFVFSPLGLLLSRMALIEYFATACGVGLVLATLLWHEDGRRRWFLVAFAAATLGLLVKATTMVMYLPPAAVLVAAATYARRPIWPWPRYLIASSMLFAVPVALGVGWLLYADGVRASNPGSAWFTAANGLTGSYFGTIQERLDPSTWWDLAGEADVLLFGRSIWLWLVLALTAAALGRRTLLALSLIGSAAIGPLLFTPQYRLDQDYYLAALSPLVATSVGLAAGWVWAQRTALLARAVLAALALAWAVSLYSTVGYWGRQYVPVYDLDKTLAAAAFVAANTAPDELVAISGQDWNPSVLYYARRRGLMIREETGPSLHEVSAAGYSRVFDCPVGQGPPVPCQIVDLGTQ